MAQKTVFDPEFVTEVENRLRQKGLISNMRTDNIDSFISTAMKNANRRLLEHKRANKGQSFYEVENTGTNNNHDRYRHDLLTEFYCDEMNKLTVAAGLRCG